MESVAKIMAPEFDPSGFLIWSDEVEAAYQANKDLNGFCVSLIDRPGGPIAPALYGCVKYGAYGEWVVRAAIYTHEDSSADVSMDFQCVGDVAPNAMYPRLPRQERFTVRLAEVGHLARELDARFRWLDGVAEEAHAAAMKGTRENMSRLRAEMLKPSPWWKFWE